MLNVLAEDSDLFTFTNMVYNAGFYFLHIYLGYTAAKKLGVSVVLGMMLAGILIEPSFVDMANNGITTLSVFGLPASVVNYSQSVLGGALFSAGTAGGVVSIIAMREKLEARGLVFDAPIFKGPSETYQMWAHDPDGNKFEIM